MIKAVLLKNWRSHLTSELTFNNGTNALIGIMGSGKSSVMDAICFGLFGTFPNLQSKKLKLDDIIMMKPSEKDKAEVEIAYQVDGDEFRIKRVIEKGKGTTYSEIRKNGTLLEAPNSQRVTEIVEKILKVNYELFSKAIYSEQNALDYFLTIPRGQRMRKIDELLMIDKFEKSRSNAVSLANKLIERKNAKQTLIESIDMELLKKEVDSLKKDLEENQKEKEEMRKQYDGIIFERNKLEIQAAEYKKIKDNLENLKRGEQGIASALEEVAKSLRSLEEAVKGRNSRNVENELFSLIKIVEDSERELKLKKQRYERTAAEINQTKAKTEFKKKDIDKLTSEIEEKVRIKKEFEHLRDSVGEDIEEQITRNKNDLKKISTEVAEFNARIEDLNKIIEHLSSKENTCPICDSNLPPEKKKLLTIKKREQLEQLESLLETGKKHIEILEAEIQKLEKAGKDLEEMIKQLKDVDSKKIDLENKKVAFVESSNSVVKGENELTELRGEIEKFEKDMKETQAKGGELEILLTKARDYEEKNERYDSLTKERKYHEVKISEVEEKIKANNYEEIEKSLIEVIALERELHTKIMGIEQLVNEKRIRLNERENKLNDLEKQKEEIEKLEKLIKNLRIFGFGLEETQVELRREFVDAVNYTMNKLWSAIYPYQDFVGIRLNVEEGDYILQLEERSGRWVNVEGTASGGERSIAALALRIAFALVLAPQLRWLVLDEPTHNLDMKAVEDLALTLRDRIGEFVDQVFLITHDENLENAVTGSLYKLERKKEVDGVTKIIAL